MQNPSNVQQISAFGKLTSLKKQRIALSVEHSVLVYIPKIQIQGKTS